MIDCFLCRLGRHPLSLFLLGLIALLMLVLVGAFPRFLLLAYLLFLALAGLIALALLAAGMVQRKCRKWAGDRKSDGSVGHAQSGSVRVPGTIYKRPDPLIYSQGWLLARGLGVTWDNPDISLFDVTNPASPVAAIPHDLAPNTPHLIRAQIWNGSFDAPAVNLLVRFWYLTFGIGGTRSFIGQTLVDLPAKGGILPVLAQIPWRTPEAPGHYCVQVELVWSDDSDLGNNIGQINLVVKKLNSPAVFSLTVRNDGAFSATLRYEFDAYRLPKPTPCTEVGEPALRVARHLRSAHPLPRGWRAVLPPEANRLLAPGEEIPFTVTIHAPDAFTGELDVNLNAFDRDRPVGGVTLRVQR